MSKESQRRLRFRFSLRTFVILITLLGCWLGWESSIVRERKAVLNEFQTKQAFRFTTAIQFASRYPPGAQLPPMASVSFLRRLIGDTAIQEIVYTPWFGNFSKADLERLGEVFPEAELIEVPAEPCHPGCFPAGSRVSCPQGVRAIETLKVGDAVTAFRATGEQFTASVTSIFTTQNRLCRIRTEVGELLTTETQPLCQAFDRVRPAGELRSGDSILYESGKRNLPVKILSVEPTDRWTTVFNIVLGDRELFVVDGYLVRSKPPSDQ